MVDPQDLRVQVQSKANRKKKKKKLKRKMAGNNLLNFTNIAQPHIHYQSCNKPNQDTIKNKTKQTHQQQNLKLKTEETQ